MKRPAKQQPKIDSIGRRSRRDPQPTGVRVELTATDIALFEMYSRHGDVPVELAHAYLKVKGLTKNLQATKKRHTKLFHEDNTIHGGPYLYRPPQQWLTANSDYHSCCHRNTKNAEQALIKEARLIENTPKSSSSFKHDFLRACFSLSTEISCLLQPDKYQYVSHDEIVNRISKDEFVVEGEKFRPDLMHGVRYLDGDQSTTRLFMVEIDCKTEQLQITPKKKHNTFENKLDNYRKYIAGGMYKDDFGLNGGLMLQVVTTNYEHMKNLIALTEKSNYMLFNYVDNFDWGWIPPKEIFTLFDEPWERPGTSVFYINTTNGLSPSQNAN